MNYSEDMPVLNNQAKYELTDFSAREDGLGIVLIYRRVII
jgi:hypothetical protein